MSTVCTPRLRRPALQSFCHSKSDGIGGTVMRLASSNSRSRIRTVICCAFRRSSANAARMRIEALSPAFPSQHRKVVVHDDRGICRLGRCRRQSDGRRERIENVLSGAGPVSALPPDKIPPICWCKAAKRSRTGCADDLTTRGFVLAFSMSAAYIFEMSMFARSLALALASLALSLSGRAAHAQAAPVPYANSNWFLGLGGNPAVD